ncbi:MAG: hypothetical protein SNJ70_09925 [Armatimonadota bacterium]
MDHCSNSIHTYCPESFHSNCEAYKSGKNCWEVEEKPCCLSNDLDNCVKCSIFKSSVLCE